MEKGREGKYIPPKGKPFRRRQSKAGQKPVYNIENLDEHNEIADKYTDGSDMPAADVRVMIPNRIAGKPDDEKDNYPLPICK